MLYFTSNRTRYIIKRSIIQFDKYQPNCFFFRAIVLLLPSFRTYFFTYFNFVNYEQVQIFDLYVQRSSSIRYIFYILYSGYTYSYILVLYVISVYPQLLLFNAYTYFEVFAYQTAFPHSRLRLYRIEIQFSPRKTKIFSVT